MKTVIDQSSSSALSKPSDARAGAAGTSQASVAAGTSHTSTAEEESDEKKSWYIRFFIKTDKYHTLFLIVFQYII